MNNQSLSSNKSVSLPKLRSNTEVQKKPLKEFHKINWSVAPRCLLQGHESQPIIYICINPECHHETRLVCEHCFYKNHSQHNKEFLAVDEVKQGKINGLRYWPFNQQYRGMYQSIKKHDSYIENLIQDIKSTFENFLLSIARAIKDIETKHLEKVTKFYQKSQKKTEYVKYLTKKVEDTFQMKQIQENVSQIFNKQIRHDIFMKNMKKILNNQNKESERNKLKQQFYSPKTQKGHDIEFDKIYFLKKQKIVISKIQEQQKSFKQVEVTADEAEVGLQLIITQTIQYLGKNATGLYPLVFQTKNLDDGTFYQGFIHKNNRVLLGLRDYKNGWIYFGEWKNNCRSGWGVYEHKENGYKYAGHWKEDKKNGFGKQVTPNFTYEGQFKQDKKEGFGIITQEGVRFDITWKNDKKHGKGKRMDNNGEVEVYFLNGVQSGGGKSHFGGEGEGKRDVSFLAKMFAQKSTTK